MKADKNLDIKAMIDDLEALEASVKKKAVEVAKE
jgi:hypothetical protein